MATANELQADLSEALDALAKEKEKHKLVLQKAVRLLIHADLIISYNTHNLNATMVAKVDEIKNFITEWTENTTAGDSPEIVQLLEEKVVNIAAIPIIKVHNKFYKAIEGDSCKECVAITLGEACRTLNAASPTFCDTLVWKQVTEDDALIEAKANNS